MSRSPMRCGRLRIWPYVAAALRRLESQMPTAVLLASAALFSGCAPEPLDFADWTIPVPEGTPIIEYAAVPLEERGERIELVEDLVIGNREDDPNYRFYQASQLAVDVLGNIYVLDAGNHRVQVFDSNGDYLQTLGARGEGPGELESPWSITLAGDKVVVVDASTARLNYWSLEGEYLGATTLVVQSLRPVGFLDGTMAGGFSVFHGDPVFRFERVFSHLSGEGEELERYAAFPMPLEMPASVPYSEPQLASSSVGDMYICPADEYQILALNASDGIRWALRTNWPTPLVPQEVFDKRTERLREKQPDYDPSRERWPERMPAVDRIAVDGRGRLYVFPYVFVPRDPMTDAPLNGLPQELPVDVYSRAGDRILSGTMRFPGWHAARDEYVYRIETDLDTKELVVVRYRLVEPF